MLFRGIKTEWKAFTVALLLVSAPALSINSSNNDPADNDLKARKRLAEKLKKVSKSYSVKEARYPEAKEAGNFDRNTGNPGDSNTTYHSYVWDMCLQMTGGGNCQKWLDPYVSQHGLEAGTEGQSPLENTVAGLWKGMKKEGDAGQGGTYGIWDIKAKGAGPVLDTEGRLDRSQLVKFELQKKVKTDVEQIGYETASKSISVTFDEDSPKNTMPNMESLRLMAGRWTRMMRNRLVSSVGELRAYSKGIEFTLGEDLPNCESYLTALQKIPDEVERERIKYQGRLDPETYGADVQRRYEMCVAARNASVQMVNPKFNNGKLVQGDPNEEQIDKWRNRLNVAAIDYGGIDLTQLPKPADQPLTENDVKSEIADWNEGGTEMRAIKVSNAEQIESYNRQLRSAAQGMKEAAARTPFIPDTSEVILKNQIKPGTVNLVELNGLTKEMKSELRGTEAPSVEPAAQQIAPTQNPNPDRNLEDTPSQLAITAAR